MGECASVIVTIERRIWVTTRAAQRRVSRVVRYLTNERPPQQTRASTPRPQATCRYGVSRSPESSPSTDYRTSKLATSGWEKCSSLRSPWALLKRMLLLHDDTQTRRKRCIRASV